MQPHALQSFAGALVLLDRRGAELRADCGEQGGDAIAWVRP
jgi:hypothetical protein